MNPEARLRALERAVAELRLRTPTPGLGNPASSTAFGASFGRPQQPGFAAKLTSTYDPVTGYDWAIRTMASGSATLENPTIPLTGTNAVEVSGRTDLAVDTEVWMELSPDGTGYVIVGQGEAGGGGATDSSWKNVVRVATTANGTLATAFENGDTVDGVTLATGDRILIKDQTSGAENGIYTVNASGAPTRATDADTSAELLGATVAVRLGTANADTIWMCATDSITLGATSLNWIQVFPNKYYEATTEIAALTTSYQESGVIELPAGKWLITPFVGAAVWTSAGSSGLARIEIRLYDKTATAEVAVWSPFIQQGTYIDWPVSWAYIVTLTVPSEIALEARKLTTETYTVARLTGGYLVAERVV